MFDTLLKAGSGFDLITPTIALIQDIRNGPTVVFALPYDMGWCGVDIKRMLNAKGIRVWGLRVIGEEITFHVRHAQARYAAYWLEREGLSYTSSLTQEELVQLQNLQQAQAVVSKPAKRSGAFENALDSITEFVDSL